jgi:DNA-binding response OmpR family regulator
MPEQNDILSEEARILKAIESGDGVTENEVAEFSGVPKEQVREKLATMKRSGAPIESRKIGNSSMWYPIHPKQVKRILIVEDDKNINDLEKATLGEDYEIHQALDGTVGLKMAREIKPDLVILDLMLPGIDGLEICQTLKKDPVTKDMIVIIVSAADAARNRFKGIKYGADYYIRKPFKPKELRSLTKIFLRKKGRRFDPLVDLPDEGRISQELDSLIGGDEEFEINNLRIVNLGSYSEEHGDAEAKVITRLVSQILQEKVQDWETKKGFVGYIGNGEFVIAGSKNETGGISSEVANDFENVLPFIYQDKKIIDIDIDGMFETTIPGKRMFIKYDLVPSQKIIETRKQFMEKRGMTDAEKGKEPPKSLGMYTYEQLRELVGSGNLDVTITRDASGTKLSVSKTKKPS